MVDRWNHLRSTPLGDFRIFTLGEDHYEHPELEGERSFMVLHCPDWVNVLAITADSQAVFIRQFRPGIRASRLELPGGVMEAGESPAEAAARELLEETGFAGDAPELLCENEPNPAVQDNTCRSFLVPNARRVAEPDWDPAEYIDVELLPVDAIEELVARNAVSHALMQIALLHWLRREG